MIDHLSIVVSDIEKARAFYDAVLATFGAKRVMNVDVDEQAHVHASGYGLDWKPVFWIGNGKPSPQGHVAFRVANRAGVDAFYQSALAAGAMDGGPPGLRPHYHEHYYAAFVIDRDGNHLEAVCHTPE
jgi:catechol 2,3-dioxygenase-like lactoylglutathione lyase family enzyme